MRSALYLRLFHFHSLQLFLQDSNHWVWWYIPLTLFFKLFNSELTNHLLQFMAKDFCNIICFIKVYIRVCHVIQMHKGWTSNRGLLWDVLRGWEVQHYDHRGSDAVYRIPKIFNSGKGGSGEIKIGESALMIKKYKQKCIC